MASYHMHKFLTFAATAALLVSCADAEDSAMAEFLSAHDMHWTSLQCDNDVKPSRGPENKRGYYSGALMGNGLVGTDLYKLKEDVYRLNVSRSDITEQRDGYDLFDRGRLAVGYFTLSTVGHVNAEEMTLSLYDAETSGIFCTDRGSIDFRTYVHAEEDYVVFETKSAGAEKDFVWDFVPFQAVSPRTMHHYEIPDGFLNSEGKSNPDPHTVTEDDIHFLVQPLARDTTFTSIAKVYAVAWKEVRKGAVRRIISTISFEDDERSALDAARATLDKAFAEPASSLRKSHRAWWHRFYADAAFVGIPDPAFERFYWMQYYKFASTARPGKPVVDLQGVWPVRDMCWPAMWVNLNIQLTYSFQAKANIGFLSQPLWDALWEHRDNLTRNVTDIPGQEDWTDAMCLARKSSYSFYSPLDPEMAVENQYEVGNLAWMLFYWYRQCLAYGDTEQMRDRLFPMLKAAVALFKHIRIVNPDGTYSLPMTGSPEYPGENLGPDSNYDLANLRQALLELLHIDTLCGIGDPLRPEWEDFLEHLVPFQYDPETGFKVTRDTEFLQTSHRHYSHLFMIYPYHMLDWNDAGERARADLSIERWKGDQGYSRTGKAAMLCSEGRGNEALEEMKIFLETFVQPNTLYAEAGPVIETPLSAVSTLHEFYMQDWGDRIRVFYGCPDEWQDARFERLRAAGAFLISAERRGGRTAWVSVLSEKGGPCTIQTDISPEELEITCDGTPVQFELLPSRETGSTGSMVRFDTAAGSTVRMIRK